MSVVPDSVLHWLYNSLKSEYHDVDRTYSDAVQVLSKYSSLAPRTEIYHFENGISALLLLLQGTLPVQFRGATYRYPVAVWLPHRYPKEPPMVFVIPTREMSVRPGQHVSVEGKVYHPYLARWIDANLNTFLAILSDVFSKEPPVIARSNQPKAQLPSPRPPQPTIPPQIPRQTDLPHPGLPMQHRPPAPPPKPTVPTEARGPYSGQDNQKPSSAAPPLPPKPGQPPARRDSLTPNDDAPGLSDRTQRNGPPLPPLPNERDRRFSPRPPVIPDGSAYPLDPRLYRQAPYGMHAEQPASPYQHLQIPPQDNHPRPHHQQPHPYQQPHHLPPGPPPPLPTQPQKQKQPPPDLISSPLDSPSQSLQSASASSTTTTLPAPPIPLNPEKDRLLSLISSTLHPLLTQSISQNASAIPALTAQHHALLTFQHALTTELTHLQSLSSTLSTNEQILHAALRDADAIDRGLSRRELPGVDDVLVAPTVVGEQLYGLVAEERGISDALFALGRALDGGRVGGEVFVRLTRGLAREQFLKRALARRIAAGMGLAVGEGWG